MNAELKETLELARAVDRIITFSEHHCATVPVRRAAERIREGVVSALRKSTNELGKSWPAPQPGELQSIYEALDKGSVPPANGLPGYLPDLVEKKLDLESIEPVASRKKAFA